MGANQQQYSLMDALADRETFITVYPNGTGRFENHLLTWNAGSCCAYAALNNIDDVGFTIALLKRLEELIPIDRRRVYATGMSNGAMMAYRLAAEVPQYFAAIAPVAGGMVVPQFQSFSPLPVIHFHSVDDPRALYNGGLGTPFPLTKSRVFHPDIDQMIVKWVDHNGCSKRSKDHRSPAGRQWSRAYRNAIRLWFLPEGHRSCFLETHRSRSCLARRKTESHGADPRSIDGYHRRKS
jgi:polyhydroxybutyrate depolymerase